MSMQIIYITGDYGNEKWIIDGMCSHGDTMDLRFETADLLIFLDINPLACLAGAIKRQGKNGPTPRQTITAAKNSTRNLS